jgi:hypothetical protein
MGLLTSVKMKFEIRRKKKHDAELARSRGISEGYLNCSSENVNAIRKLNERVEELTKALAETETRIRSAYKKQLEEADKKQKDKCVICQQGVDGERRKLIELQEEFRCAIVGFMEYEKKLNRFVAKFETTFNTMLQQMGRLSDSESELSIISRDFNSFVKKNTELIEMDTLHI